MQVSGLSLASIGFAAIGLIPRWPYRRSSGYYPSGLVGFLIVLIVLAPSGPLQGVVQGETDWKADTRFHERSCKVAKYGKKAQQKVKRAMHERKHGTLRSGRSGKRVTSRKQAIAIGLSEARREGGKAPRARKGGGKKR